MLTEFYSYELHNILIVTSTALFFPISIFGSYVILFKTPPTIRAFKFPFFYLNSCYQIAIFCVGVLSGIDITSVASSMCVTYSGFVVAFGRIAVYIEVFIVFSAMFGVINAVFLSFLCRYFQVCHPKSLYSLYPSWQKAVNVGFLVATTVIIAVVYAVEVSLYAEERAIPQEKQITICFGYQIKPWLALGVVYSTASLLLDYFFICRVLWTMKSQISIMSQKTKEMQRMLTITLVISVLIPTVLGGGPIFAAAFGVITHLDHAEVFFRFLFVACIWQGLLNVTATIFLRLRKFKTMSVASTA
ncbi:hypothetical protein QR680_010871 [Steinernema hermaphroditum]|uniref:Uncharacterized protein n=1 Tax=Steinernema hermaphroditum TaxID=289476 RepID=A0AA39MC94_9BILA|nr:hypothetical protein QR680_010871 [Steinernema hermaphroditum]